MEILRQVLTRPVYLLIPLLLLAIVGLTFHFHPDGSKHDDCSFCYLQSHFFAVAQSVSAPIVLLVGIAVFIKAASFVRTLHYLNSSIRSPPA
jgi:hypothetical protein